MSKEPDQYPTALAQAIADDLLQHPVSGDLARVVIRWFDGPLYLTIHALGTDDETGVSPEDAWYPLVWPNLDAEIARADRILAQPPVAATGASVEATLDEGSWDWELDAPPGDLVAAASQVPDALRRAGVPLAEHLAVGVTHFEGWGAEASVPLANEPSVVQALEQRGLLPDE